MKRKLLAVLDAAIKYLTKLQKEYQQKPAEQTAFVVRKLKPKLNTRFGGVIDKLSYYKILFWIFVIIVGFAVVFKLLNPYDQGTTKSDLDWVDTLYFSVVTFATLGYGDIAAKGAGRLLVITEVMSGMFFMAVFIGKISSERQATKLKLIYSSINHRTISTYIADLGTMLGELQETYLLHDNPLLAKKMQDAYDFVSVIRKYLTQQALEGELTEYGNPSTLRRLYVAMSGMQKFSTTLTKTYGMSDAIVGNARRIITSAFVIGQEMQQFHQKEPGTMGNLNELVLQMARSQNETPIVHRTMIVPALLDRVKAKMNAYPDPLASYRQIAAEMGMTNKLCQRCIALNLNGHPA
ncbi:hypothetical protein A0256_00200 [Mucilaginibacter sp. PAMC 26640]|nr:hypothetical protein A0256_00200 [Mucilaginibacter sp. PAMC 26640]